MKDKRPTFRINFNTKDKELIDFLETTFPTIRMNIGTTSNTFTVKIHFKIPPFQVYRVF